MYLIIDMDDKQTLELGDKMILKDLAPRFAGFLQIILQDYKERFGDESGIKAIRLSARPE